MTDNAASCTPSTLSMNPKPTDPSLPAPPLKYLVGVLYYGPIDREHDRCVKQLKDHPLVYDVLELTGCPYIDIGRSIIATAVLDNPELGGLLFIDHDMVFDPSQAILAIESAIESQATVGAAYSMRRPGRIIGAVDGSKLAADEKVVFFEGGERRPANYLGMGMTAIPRSVLVRLVAHSQAQHARRQLVLAELRDVITGTFDAAIQRTEGAFDAPVVEKTHALSLLDEIVLGTKEEDLQRLSSGISDAPVVPFFSLLRERGYYYGEDVSFCVRNHQAEVPICLDTRIRVYHKGSYCYGLEDVGMEVPYCERLECLDVADPKSAPALFSKSPEIAEALQAEVAQSARIHEFTSYPASFDPTAAAPALPLPAEAAP